MVPKLNLPPLKSVVLPVLSANLRLLPNDFHSAALARLANHFMKGQTFLAQLQELEGKCIAVHIRDVQKLLRVVIRGAALVPASAADDPHVTIEGNLDDFLLLATRREDPDTLFFQRRLALIGDVATGLCVKNLLDGIEYDWDAHVRAVLGPFGQPFAAPLRKWSTLLVGAL